MEVRELLDRPIAYHRCFVKLTGSVTASVMLSQAIYWMKRTTDPSGWFYKTQEEWEEETGLTRREQETARKKAEKYLKSDLRGVPAKLFYWVDEEALYDDLIASKNGEIDQPSMAENAKQETRKTPSIHNTEITTNTTSYIDTKMTPSKEMVAFLDDPKPMIDFIVEKGVPESIVREQITRFVMYWTEPNKSGTKVRWEMEKTWDVKRRLATWFSNFKGWNKGGTNVVRIV